MKRILSAALVLSLLSGTAAFAKGDKGDKGEKHDNRGYSQDRDERGDRHDDRGYSQNRDDRGNNNGYDSRSDRHDNGNHYGQQKHRWVRGERLPVTYYQNRSYYVDYRRAHLRAPPSGYQWVQVDNNYVMVALATGLIASLIAHN